MRQRKLKFLLVTLLVVSGFLFAGGEARAATFSYTINPTVGISQNQSSASYTYEFAITPGSLPVQYIDFEVPVNICIKEGVFSGSGVTSGCTPIDGLSGTPGYSNSGGFTVSFTGATSNGGEVFCRSCGDFGSKFGYGDSRIRVLKANISNPGSIFTVKLSFTGQNFGEESAGVPYIFGTNTNGVLLLKASQGTNTQSFGTKTPVVVVQSKDPAPVISGVSVNPNPILSGCTYITWSLDKGTATVTGPGTITNGTNSATVCPGNSPGTYTYTITATCPTCSSSTESPTVTVASPPGAPTVTLSANPGALISGEEPHCSTLTWGSTGAAPISVAITAEPGGSVATGLGPSGSLPVCPKDNGTYTYTVTATNAGGPSSPATATLIVNEPAIQTSCMQILKQPVNKPPMCINVCFEIGGAKRLVSAEKYDSADCSGTPTKLAVFGPDVANPLLQVAPLSCAPCGIDAGADGKSGPCSGVPYGTSTATPFDVVVGPSENQYTVRCESFVKAYEPSGVTFDLGEDPQFYTGARMITVNVCPTGYIDCAGYCKRSCN